MTTTITEEAVRALSDGDLVKVEDWIAAEQKAREKRRKEQTLAKIKELAKSIEVGVKIEGIRGRPRRTAVRHNASPE